MKIKSKKFVLGTLLTTCSLAIVSSITSTFAWYSYNTKNGMAFTGVATGKSENLQVRLSGEDDTKWRTTLTSTEVSDHSSDHGFSSGNLAPLTQANGLERKGAKAALDMTHDYGFYNSPSRLNPKSAQAGLKDADGNYYFFRTTLQFRCVDPVNDDALIERNIYISNMAVKAISDDKDITSALRININQGTSTHYNIAPGYAENKDFKLTGPLNLAGAVKEDPKDPDPTDHGVRYAGEKGKPTAKYRDPYEWETEDDMEEVIYGNVVDAVEQCYGYNETVSTFDGSGKLSSTKLLIGKTSIDPENPTINVNITIWLEGWDPAVKNENIGAEFAFGLQFECETL